MHVLSQMKQTKGSGIPHSQFIQSLSHKLDTKNRQDLLSSATLEVLNNSSHRKLSRQMAITHIDFNMDLLIQKYYNLKSSRFQQSSGREQNVLGFPRYQTEAHM